ncbi:MAG: hypothetical protein H0Z39_10675 [Peptococcaceae bacterium]|nr:hypothetical protein [Peptococcaceae bacterium]
MTEDRNRESLFTDGVIPEKKHRKAVSWLFLEGDGVAIHLQRESQKRGEIKLGLAE